MIKRFVARLLIITQVYGSLFQGVLHADITQDYLVRDQIHLRAIHGEEGSRFALGTNSDSDSDDETELLDIIDVPTYQALSKSGPQLGDPTLNLTDVFTLKGVTRDVGGVRFTLQGLSVFMNNAGHLLVQGTQTDFTKPIFLSTEHPIILDNVRASALQITAPRIITTGISVIDTLRVEGERVVDHESAVFVNAGQLTAREFFLKNLKGQNTGGIAATRFAVDGQLASTGSIYSSELILEEAAFLRLSETSRADIKTLFLSEASHFETFETTNAVSIGVLDSLGGSLTNHGSLMIDEVAVDSAFQAITNRHFLDIALGSIRVEQFENHGTLDAGQSDIQVTDGQNLGALKTKSLQVVTAFTNTPSGVIETSLVSGSGHLRNLGGIETQGDLSIAIKRFSNSGQTVGQSIEGASTLEQVDNMQDGVIESTVSLRFTDVTQVNNLGALRSEEMALYSDKTLQKGELTARKLNLLGQAFLNQGEIEVDHLTAENGLINQVSLATFRSTDFGAGGLTNRVKATTKLRGLGLSGDTAITNHGKLKIEGVDTALGVLHITNTGGATTTIDAGHALPSSSAVISVPGGGIDHEFDGLTEEQVKIKGSYYKSLRMDTSGDIDAEFIGLDAEHSKTQASTYKLQVLAGFRARTLQDLQDQLSEVSGRLLGAQPLLEKTDQLRVVAERYQILDVHFKPERDLIEMGLGGIVTSLMRPGLILEPIRAEHLRKREELKQLTAEKRALEQELAANSRMVEQRQKAQAQIAAYQQLAPELFKVRLSVTNQATGKLTLRSGHFDLTTDQALQNHGVLTQEAAQYHLLDPSTWSAPRSFNAGTWAVKGTLTLLGNAAKNVGKLKVDDSLHVDVPAVGSKVLRGQIETTDFSAGSGIELFGTLVTHRSTHLPQGLTIAADAVADLKGLKLTGGEINNLGSLRVSGVDPNSGIIKLTNSGTAMIDDQRVLPNLDEHSPENLARVATNSGPITWENYLYSHLRVDHEFINESQITHKRAGSKYLRLFNALEKEEACVAVPYNYSDPTFDSLNGLNLKRRASINKRAFIKRYESDFAKSQTEGSAAEQAALQEYLKPFSAHYKQVLTSREAYAKSSHPAVGTALVLESAQIPAVKLQLLNQASGQLTLKSGKFEFVGDAALVNDGILTQHNAYTLWLTKTPGAFNRGVWRAKGSLGLLGHNGNDMGDLQVEDTLHVNATCDALIALDALAKLKARRVTLQAPHLQELPETPVRASRTYPWPLEMLLSCDFGGNVDISAPVLKISSRIFQTSGNIYAHSGVFDLSAEYGVKTIHAFLGGRDGMTLRSKTLGILANKIATGAAVPNILYKRPELGLYSEAGPVVVNVAELITCHYGDIKGTSFTITAPQLINTVGLICATEPGLKSVLNVKNIKHVRDEQGSHSFNGRCGGHPSMSISAKNRYNHNNLMWCGGSCNRQNATYETSGEAILFAQGDLDVTYETLEMLASSITSLGTLKLVSKGVSLDVPNLAVGAELPALPGTTTMTKRNGHVNRLVAKHGLVADVGTADMAADMRGENIHIQAALLTLRSLGIAPQQQAQFIDLFTQESSSSALQMVGVGDRHNSRYVDTILPLTHKALPDSLVVLGLDATRQMHSGAMLDVQMSMRAIEEIMGNQIYTLIRGVKGLGLSVTDFFKSTSNFVRGHKDTVSQRRLIKAGEDQQEVEVQFNATLTPKDIVASGLPAVFMQFSETINTLEAEQDALAAVTSKPRVMMGIPADDAERGIIAEKTVVLESATDLSVATSVKAKEQVSIVAQDTLTVASDIIHHQSGENYTQTLDRSMVESDRVLLQGHDVHLKSIDTHSTQRTDIIATGGNVVDESVPLVSHRVDHYSSKKEYTTVRTTHVHQTTSSHRSDGTATIEALAGGILQQGTKLTNARLEAPVIIQDTVHDQHMVDVETIRRKKSGGMFGGWFGITARKTTHSSAATSTARGAINAGREFIANATTRFRAVAPTFTAHRSDITAPEIELATGVSQHQAFTQSTYQGAIWNKSSQSTEKHITHCNPTFEHNVYLHSPSVILERVKGSTGTFDKILSDTPVQFREVIDTHQSTHQRQKSLSAGATLILSLAVTLATANPGAAASIEGAMLSAAYGSLCSQTAICLVEKDGNLGRAIDELGRRNIGKTMLISAVSAGLTKGLGDKLGITGSTAFDNLAKKHLLQSAINTTLSVAIDGQRPEDAIKQGLTSAAINTLAAYAAGKIGDVRSTSSETRGGAARIDAGTHKLLHGILGAGSGVLAGAITQQDIARSALSGSVGGVLGETFAELTGNKHLGDLLATSLAFGTGLDSIIAYQTSHNATEHNWKAHPGDRMYLEGLGLIEEEKAAYGEGEDERTEKQQAYERGRSEFVKGSLDRERQTRGRALSFDTYDMIVENANQLYARSCGSAEAMNLLGQGIVTTSEMVIPGMRGINQAWMGTVNYGRGELSQQEWRNEVVGGINSSVTDGALCMATFGVGKGVMAVVNGVSRPTNKLSRMVNNGGTRVKAYVKDQFNYREHFAAERLRLEAGKTSTKFGRYAEAEDLLGLSQAKTGSGFGQFDARANAIGMNQTTAAREAAKVSAQLELSHNIGCRQAFDRKLIALQDLADRGKLFKSANIMRDESVTFAYRRNILAQAYKQWWTTDPARVQRIEQALKTRLHADHLHELQLGGVDHGSALSLLDKQVNMSVGSQVMHQLKDVPVGAKITSVIEKASKK